MTIAESSVDLEDATRPPGAPAEPAPVSSGSYWNSGQQSYDVYRVETSYRDMKGLLQLPTAGPDPTAARVVRVHAPYMLKVVKWEIATVCSLGVLPVLPHWDTGDTNDVLCYRDIRPQAPVITPGGNGFIWVVVGEYHYYRLTPATTYPAGATPLSIVTAGNFVFTEANFSKAVLDTTDPGIQPILTNPIGPYSAPAVNARF